jgi:hypothetical protein
LSEKATHAFNIIRGLSTSYLRFAIFVLGNFLLTPVILERTGQDGYGLWATIRSVMANLLLLDFGLTPATTKFVAEYSAQEDQKALNGFVSTALSTYLVLAALVLGIGLISNGPIAHFLNFPRELVAEGRMVLLLTSLTVAIRFPATVLSGLIYGHQRLAVLDATKIAEIVGNGGIMLTISGPDLYLQKEYRATAHPTFESTDSAGNPLPDGIYVYELQLMPVNDGEAQPSIDDAERGIVPVHGEEPLVHGGAFTIVEGCFAIPTVEADDERLSAAADPPDPVTAPADQCIYDDLIVDGSFCVGFDCVCDMSFGYDTIVLKENNLRIFFDDTSTIGSYPRNDWRITVNDSTNGGASYFGIDDATGGRSPFKIEAGAPAHSLYVDDYGRVGFGTSTPYVEAHIKDSDTPTVRLEQDGSGGWTPQTWDVAGNESNFFIRDVTNGSRLPFRIRPGAPSSSIFIDTDGDVGLGTSSPGAKLDVTDPVFRTPLEAILPIEAATRAP